MGNQKTSRKLLVTSALPYANGPIHLGHLLEHIQADIWVRFQKMMGRHCIFISGEDAHGTPIMLAAQQRHVSADELIKQIAKEHLADLSAFHIEFDCYHTTHSPENEELTTFIYEKLLEKGDIYRRTIQQAYDEKMAMFLPDRYVKGSCPCCKSSDQYGDNCEVCSATYSPLDLHDPKSTLSGTRPIAKQSEHYFFQLARYSSFLRNWITNERHLSKEIRNKLLEWFSEGLHDLDISRDTPYFGFKIPRTQEKYFYVWIDAPIGYMATFNRLCKSQSNLNFEDYWKKTTETELYHFIGKDIVNFHGIIWPALLKAAEFRTPTALFVHGYVTVQGRKMSKSKGTFISARHYLDYFDPEYLRYYFATKLNNKAEDVDFNFKEFSQKINSDLIGKLINIASRCAYFINKKFENKLSEVSLNSQLIEKFVEKSNEIESAYENREYHHAVRVIMNLTEDINQMINDEAPWNLVKNPSSTSRAQDVCSLGLNLFRILILYLKPILPFLAQKVEHFLNVRPLLWAHLNEGLYGHTINNFTPLLNRIPVEAYLHFKCANLL